MALSKVDRSDPSRVGISLWVFLGGQGSTAYQTWCEEPKKYAESQEWKQAAREIESTLGLNTEHKA